jgi:hypothetical protein
MPTVAWLRSSLPIGWLVILVALSLIVQTALAETPTLGLSVREDGVLVREGKPYRGIGFNYFNALGRHVQKADDTSFEAGFQQLEEAKIPFVRLMGCGFWPIEQKLYQSDKAEFFRRFDRVVQSAERHHVGLIPSLFWHTSTVPDLVGEPVNQWGIPESKTHAYLREYVRDVVTRYKDSPAIWGWEFGNEYNLAADLPNAESHRPPVVPVLGTAASRGKADELSSDAIRAAYAAFGREVRKVDPWRVITTGDSRMRPCAWNCRTHRSWAPDTPEQTAEMYAGYNQEPINLVSIHAYGDCLDELRLAMRISRGLKKPLWVGEFGCPGPVDKTKAEFLAMLDAIEKAEVPLAAVWVFDFAPQTEISVSQDNERAYELRAVAEANARIQAALP